MAILAEPTKMELIPLGVQIYKSKISEEFYNFLLNEYENNLINYTRMYQNENFWNGSDYSFVHAISRPTVEKHLFEHIKEYTGHTNFRLINQWINIQAHDGFFPVHEHMGTISYVIYLKVPDFKKNYKGKRINPVKYNEGNIQFFYGHKNSLFPEDLRIAPEEGMILIFPAELKHFVYPFQDKDQLRVSVSGNFQLKNEAPITNGTK